MRRAISSCGDSESAPRANATTNRKIFGSEAAGVLHSYEQQTEEVSVPVGSRVPLSCTRAPYTRMPSSPSVAKI